MGVTIAVALSLSAGALAERPLRTSFVDPVTLACPDSDLDLARMSAAGATAVRLTVYWSQVAPAGIEVGGEPREPRRWVAPAEFDATNPDDPAYRWEGTDRQVKAAVAHSLDPILTVQAAPLWAEDGDASVRSGQDWRVDPTEFGRFGSRAARLLRQLRGLPRVRYRQAWNEPNLSFFLGPQLARAGPEDRSRERHLHRSIPRTDQRVRGRHPFGASRQRRRDGRARPGHDQRRRDCDRRGSADVDAQAALPPDRKPPAPRLSRSLLRRVGHASVHVRRPDAPREPPGRRLARRPAGPTARPQRRRGGPPPGLDRAAPALVRDDHDVEAAVAHGSSRV